MLGGGRYNARVSSDDLLLKYPPRRLSSAIRVRRGSLASLGAWIRSLTGIRRVALVTDSRVDELHGDRARKSLARAGVAVEMLVVPRGERAKAPQEIARLWDAFAAIGLERGDGVVALGGGVVGDLAGFAAATWMRGIEWIAVPSTVVAQVDSSVGGKTGVDLLSGKNLAGAFHHPSGVLVDPDLLQTLAPREYRAGMAEVVKTGFAVDAALFRALERDCGALTARAPLALEQAVLGSIRAKAGIVRRDEREREGGVRTALNFGHTLGHAIESALGYRGPRHGEAVAIGMRVAARLSQKHAGLDPRARQRLEVLLDAWHLPAGIPGVPVTDLLAAMAHDKKRRDARVRWVLTPRLGHASVPRLIPAGAVRAALIEAGARQ